MIAAHANAVFTGRIQNASASDVNPSMLRMFPGILHLRLFTMNDFLHGLIHRLYIGRLDIAVPYLIAFLCAYFFFNSEQTQHFPVAVHARIFFILYLDNPYTHLSILQDFIQHIIIFQISFHIFPLILRQPCFSFKPP